MAQTLMELTAEIVSSHAGNTEMTSEQLLQELQKVHALLKALEAGQEVEGGVIEQKPALTVKEAFKKNEVICLICGKGGMKALTRHLNQVHNMKPREYRKQFGIPSSQSLTAKSFSESRRKMANERGLADNLAKARAVRAANIKAKKVPKAKAVKEKVAAKPKATKAAKAK